MTDHSSPLAANVLAQPAQPQQLFVLAASPQQHRGYHTHLLAQRLHSLFGQALVLQLLVPDAPASSHAEALLAAVGHWQRHSGLDASCTALIGCGQSASTALSLWASQPPFCGRLFALYGADSLPALPAPPPAVAHDHTCVYMLCHQTPADVRQGMQQWQHWLDQADAELALDMHLDILPECAALRAASDSDSSDSPDTSQSGAAAAQVVQQRIVWLLQNHAPRRLWREALAAMGQQGE